MVNNENVGYLQISLLIDANILLVSVHVKMNNLATLFLSNGIFSSLGPKLGLEQEN